MTSDEAKWLLTDYNQIRHYGKISNHIDAHIKAMSIIKETNVKKPSCSCEWASYARMASSMYDQHLSKIQAVANEGQNPSPEAGS